MIALVILGIGLLVGLFEPSNFLFCLPVLALEGVVYLLVKLPSWVLAWNAGMVVKIAFLAMPYLIVIGVVILIIGACLDNNDVLPIIGGIIAVLGIISGIVAAVWAFIPSTAWRIAAVILVPLGLAFICVCGGEMGGGGSDSSSGSGGLLSEGYGSEQC